jgi:hypothetical protein
MFFVYSALRVAANAQIFAWISANNTQNQNAHVTSFNFYFKWDATCHSMAVAIYIVCQVYVC